MELDLPRLGHKDAPGGTEGYPTSHLYRHRSCANALASHSQLHPSTRSVTFQQLTPQNPPSHLLPATPRAPGCIVAGLQTEAYEAADAVIVVLEVAEAELEADAVVVEDAEGL